MALEESTEALQLMIEGEVPGKVLEQRLVENSNKWGLSLIARHTGPHKAQTVQPPTGGAGSKYIMSPPTEKEEHRPLVILVQTMRRHRWGERKQPQNLRMAGWSKELCSGRSLPWRLVFKSHF